MKNNEVEPLGCIVAILSSMITLPIWYLLLFGLLQRTDAPSWQWVCFWIYLPVGFIVAVLTNVLRVGRN